MTRESESAVYRMFDATGQLLYVGMSVSLPARLSSHRAGQAWWPDVTKVTVAHYASRREAAKAEREAIRDESPKHNRLRGTWKVTHDTRAEKDADDVSAMRVIASVVLPRDLHDAAKTIASKRHRSLSGHIRALIEADLALEQDKQAA